MCEVELEYLMIYGEGKNTSRYCFSMWIIFLLRWNTLSVMLVFCWLKSSKFHSLLPVQSNILLCVPHSLKEVFIDIAWVTGYSVEREPSSSLWLTIFYRSLHVYVLSFCVQYNRSILFVCPYNHAVVLKYYTVQLYVLKQNIYILIRVVYQAQATLLCGVVGRQQSV